MILVFEAEGTCRALKILKEAGRHFLRLPNEPVERIVLRLGNSKHEECETAELSMVEGVKGDRWNPTKDPERECQVTLMSIQVAKLVTADTLPIHLPGDNFLVNLDLSEESLPIGTRLRIGEAELEISAKPHTGCAKFSARFGAEALRWINIKEHRARRLRGVNCRVTKAGVVNRGDTLEVN